MASELLTAEETAGRMLGHYHTPSKRGPKGGRK